MIIALLRIVIPRALVTICVVFPLVSWLTLLFLWIIDQTDRDGIINTLIFLIPITIGCVIGLLLFIPMATTTFR